MARSTQVSKLIPDGLRSDMIDALLVKDFTRILPDRQGEVNAPRLSRIALSRLSDALT